MNRRTTPVLLAILLLMGALAYITEHRGDTKGPDMARHAITGSTAFTLRPDDITKVRVKRDYWNTFTLARGADGTWRMVEPSDEAVSDTAVRKLLAAIEALQATTVIDLPADDTERHRQYGLWTPTMEVSISAVDSSQTLLVGTATPDGKGVYCARTGQDKVMVVSADAMQPLSQDPSAYRQPDGAPHA